MFLRAWKCPRCGRSARASSGEVRGGSRARARPPITERRRRSAIGARAAPPGAQALRRRRPGETRDRIEEPRSRRPPTCGPPALAPPAMMRRAPQAPASAAKSSGRTRRARWNPTRRSTSIGSASAPGVDHRGHLVGRAAARREHVRGRSGGRPRRSSRRRRQPFEPAQALDASATSASRSRLLPGFGRQKSSTARTAPARRGAGCRDRGSRSARRAEVAAQRVELIGESATTSAGAASWLNAPPAGIGPTALAGSVAHGRRRIGRRAAARR